MAKKAPKCPEFENHERWLIAFADMMTLLFALFVVLYAIATVELDKLKSLSESMQNAFGVKDDTLKEVGVLPQGPTREEGIFRFVKGNTAREQILTRVLKERAAIISAESSKLEMSIAERLYGSKSFPSSENKPENRVVYVSRDPDGIRVSLVAMKFFKVNSYELDPESKKTLEGIGLAVRGLGRLVRVEGHTDDIPFRKEGIGNWELSALRAVAVTTFFISQVKFDSQMVYAAAYGPTRPIAANDNPEDRALNRRVDIKILFDIPQGDSVPGAISDSFGRNN